MKHALILVTVALITITIVFIIYRPDLIEKFWLWIVGLIGPIIGLLKEIVKYLIKLFKTFDNHAESEA